MSGRISSTVGRGHGRRREVGGIGPAEETSLL